MSNCRNKIWLKGAIFDSIADWLVISGKISDVSKADPDVIWSHYGITIGNQFDSVCNDVSKDVKQKLKKEGCPPFAGIPAGQWRLDHVGEKITVFMDDVADLIISPPAAGHV